MGRLMRIGFLGLMVLGTEVSAQSYPYDNYSTLDNSLRLYCNRETAYSTGVSDARKGLARKEDFAEVCKTNRAVIDQAYNSGYNFGLTNQSGIIVNEPAPAHPEVQYQLPSSQAQIYTRPVAQAPNGYAVAPGTVGAPYGAAVNPNAVPSNGTSTPAYAGAENSGDSRASRSPLYPDEESIPTGDLARPEPTHGLQTLTTVQASGVPKCIQTASGQACGFNCVNSLNNVRCSASPDQVCRSNNNGVIACGYHCISTDKTVKCAAFPTDGCVSDSNGYVFCGQNCRITGNAHAVCDIERYAP